ncbi:MAG TPA: TolC family protein [Saprospiraceae bacterium]|nr:TolC family protein [Saprospiraceae bacterium]HMP24924.1 TolC family protein [Saprospiraceae bacterium]
MNFTRLLFFILLLGSSAYAEAQSNTLNRYIEQGIASSEVLKQQQFQLQRSLHALEEAKGLFLPSVNLQGTYTLAAGGRAIAFPVGDLLNGVYATLNELTGTPRFPQLENVEENFNPNNFYDLKIRATYPIVNPDIRYNRQIREQTIDLQQSDIEIYKQALAKDIRIAYFQYVQANEAVRIYENALTLLRESLRVNRKLFENDMVNRTVVVRSENEITKVEAQLLEAQNNMQNAAAYFNFLLNQPFDTPIATDDALAQLEYNFPTDFTGSADNREELRKLVVAQGINQTALQMNEAYKIPKVNAFLDAGSQGFDFQVGNGSLYLLGGLSFDLPIYSGNRNKQKIKMAEMDVATIQSQRAQVADQLALQLRTSVTDYQSALQLFRSSRTQARTAQRYFDDVSKLYREGQALYIEYLDARNELTNAELQQVISLFNVWQKWTEVQFALGN